MSRKNLYHEYRKWFGLVWLLIELNLLGGNILGFAALFDILPMYGVYSNLCYNVTDATDKNNETVTLNCVEQTGKYQLALTVGIWFYNLMPFFLGLAINYFGCRFIKLVSLIFHVFGWLALAFVGSKTEYLLYIHTIFTSIASSIFLITAFVYCGYFSRHRGLVSSIIAGAIISSTMWFSIFQVLIKSNRTNLKILSIIWTLFGFLITGSSFLFMDWRFQLFKLPYGFDTTLEMTDSSKKSPMVDGETAKDRHMPWHKRIIKRIGVWRHLLNPIYIFVVLYMSALLLPAIFLPVTWYPWVMYITNNNEALSNKYTFIYNLSTTAALIICPLSGAVLDFRATRNQKQKLLNIAIMQTITWCTAVALCIIRMMNTVNSIVAALVLNTIERALIVGGSQSVIATFFPTKYISTLTGILWTAAAIFSSIQYGLLQLVEFVDRSWRAWLIILCLVVVMSSHCIQMWYLFLKEKRYERRTGDANSIEVSKIKNNSDGNEFHHQETIESTHKY